MTTKTKVSNLPSKGDIDANDLVYIVDSLDSQSKRIIAQYLLDRSNHIGTQTAATISNFDTAVAGSPQVSQNTLDIATNASDISSLQAIAQPTGASYSTSFSLSENISLVSASGGNVVCTIDPASLVNYVRYNVVKTDNSPNIVSCVPSSGTINGDSSFDLLQAYESITIVSDGSNLYII